jgi:2-phospho-L-lactate guanylyltransferase
MGGLAYDADVDDPGAAQRGPIVALVPVGSLQRAKSRLGGSLDAEERHDLVLELLERTLRATAAAPSLAATIVVTPDTEVADVAAALGAAVLRQRSRGLNLGLVEGRARAVDDHRAHGVLVLPADLPSITPDAIEAVLAAAPAAPSVVIVPDRHGRGTNALLLAPPDVIEFQFGGDSRAAHTHAANDRGAHLVELDGPLALDLDTPEDLLLVQAGAGADTRATA